LGIFGASFLLAGALSVAMLSIYLMESKICGAQEAVKWQLRPYM